MSTGAAGVPPEIARAMGGAEPTPQQWDAIRMPLEPCVVVAGAGSGKTTVMAARIVYLALAALGRVPGVDRSDGALPGDVLCLTFTNKATEHLRRRVRSALAAVDLAEGEEPTILNYHGFAMQVLERHGLLVGLEPGTRLVTPAQRTELCVRVLDETVFEHVNSTWQPTLVQSVLELDDQASNHGVPPERIIEFCEQRLEELAGHRGEGPFRAALERIELARAVQRLRGHKRRLGVIDFGDQITLALRAATEFGDLVRADYRGRFRAVVLDEFQDTNVAQARLIREVFGDGFPVTAVGDPDQNIYAWRGASLYNLLRFPQEFPAGARPARRLPLYVNFRSGARILAAADRVIAPLPAAQRPDPDKRLEPDPRRGAGEVEVRRFADAWEEARWVAARARDLHDADPGMNPWEGMAVLCRKSRLFGPLREALVELGIPVEVVGLAGLLQVPEVVEVLAYARAVADPADAVSHARILLGPRYRVGHRDLARLAGWARGRNLEQRGGGRGRSRGDDDERTAFLLSEALAHLDEVRGLSDEGRARLDEFGHEIAGLREEARRPVGEFLAEVIRRTGIAAEIDTLPDPEVRAARRRNLATFLDQAHGFSPVEGELTLRALLDHVDTVAAGEGQDWSPAQPGAEASVKVMTVHQAKGLEFDTVFVPGLAGGIFPDTTVQQNPARSGRSLDFELRGDREILPAYQGNLRAFQDLLREQELFEERRTCYVALTRARARLFVTGAWWYGEGGRAKGPSEFFEELAAWGEESGLGLVDRGPAPPEEGDPNPLLGYRRRFARDWPGPARPEDADGLFPEGWRRAAEAATADPAAVAGIEARIPEAERGRLAAAAAARREVAAALAEREGEQGRRSQAGPPPRRAVSVAGVIEYERCPRRFYWTAVRPLPRFSGPAARIGTALHSWIERRSTGQATLFELDERPDLTAEELTGEPGKVERLQQAFLASRFAGVAPLFAERPFLLAIGGFAVSGRIDAVYGASGGPWEVVDYKTGRRPPQDDPLAGLQLDVYGLACADVFGKRAEDLTLTYLYLASGEEATRPVGDLPAVRTRVSRALAGIRAEEFDPAPNPGCRWCDFLPFCAPGRASLERA